MSKSGTERVGGLTEAQISEELEGDFLGEMPANLRNASNTIAWWRSRQALLDFKVRGCLIRRACEVTFQGNLSSPAAVRPRGTGWRVVQLASFI